jgi:hypothetical protein
MDSDEMEVPVGISSKEDCVPVDVEAQSKEFQDFIIVIGETGITVGMID